MVKSNGKRYYKLTEHAPVEIAKETIIFMVGIPETQQTQLNEVKNEN